MASRAKSARPVSARDGSKQGPRLVVGISGASGVVYGIRLLELLQPTVIETHLVMSRTAEQAMAFETDRKVKEVRGLADVVHAVDDLAAAISSGSYQTMGMIVAPCSVKTLAEIASGVTTTLISRAADVTLKERRRLVLMVRETPLHAGHLRNMLAATEIGAIIAPPVPAMYARPQSLEAMVDHSLGRVLDLFGIDTGKVMRWGQEHRRRSPR
ncbi:MAG TPA: UbiX family flavin prenyltransferase [Candidatus Binatia bacterium]|nr:UbiX family flavin prenyltransferase [Candidatus Binatia bacterium]